MRGYSEHHHFLRYMPVALGGGGRRGERLTDLYKESIQAFMFMFAKLTLTIGDRFHWIHINFVACGQGAKVQLSKWVY